MRFAIAQGGLHVHHGEAILGPLVAGLPPAGLHTPYEKLAALPADLRAKMRLLHYPDDFDTVASSIEVLR